MATAKTYTNAPNKKAMVQKVQIARRQMKMDDEAYYGMLTERFGVESSTKLTIAQLADVLNQFVEWGWKPTPGKKRAADKHGKPSNATKPLLRKIEALLAEKGSAEGRHIPWDYAMGILRSMYKQNAPERLEWATAAQLNALIAALTKDAARKGLYGREVSGG